MTPSPIDMQRLNSYLDDALGPAQRKALEAEIAASSELNAELATLARLDAELRTLSPPSGDDELLVHATVGRIGAMRTRRSVSQLPWIVAAALLIGFAWFAGRTLVHDVEGGPSPEPGTLASLEFVRGPVRVAPNLKFNVRVERAARVHEGDELGTDKDGGAVVRGDDGVTLWLDANSVVRWSGARSLAIERGRAVVAVDAAPRTFTLDGLGVVATAESAMFEVEAEEFLSKGGPNIERTTIRVLSGELVAGGRRVVAGESVAFDRGVLGPAVSAPDDARWFLELEAAARAAR